MADTETQTEAVNPAGTRRNRSRQDITGLSLEELTALARDIEDRRQALIRENRDRITQEIKGRLGEAGLTPEDLFPALARRIGLSGPGRKNRLAAIRKPAPKYRGPNGDTWTGRGYAPKWLTDLEAQGRSRKEFLIENSEPISER